MPNNSAPITHTGEVFNYYEDVKDSPISRTSLETPTGTETEDELTALAGEKLAIVRVPFKPGDIAIRPKTDASGRAAIRGRHTNYGYSGYFLASIFDGRKWRNFRIFNFVPEKDRQYANQRERSKQYERVVSLIETRAGSTARWRDRAYEIPATDPAHVDTKPPNP
jgi:hypothetical protein